MAGGKLGRSSAHREAMLGALVCGLVLQERVTTTLAKARLARREAERLVTVARKGTLAARRQVLAVVPQERAVRKLFDVVVGRLAGRAGGYTRIVKLGSRHSDGSEMAILEWVGYTLPQKEAAQPEQVKKV